MLFVTDEPRTTDLLPPSAREKSKGTTSTVRSNVVVFVMVPFVAVRTIVVTPRGVEGRVVRVRVEAHPETVGVQEAGENTAVMLWGRGTPAGRDAENVTGSEVPAVREALTIFVTDDPRVTDLSESVEGREKLKGSFTMRLKEVVLEVAPAGVAVTVKGIVAWVAAVVAARVSVEAHVGAAEERTHELGEKVAVIPAGRDTGRRENETV